MKTELLSKKHVPSDPEEKLRITTNGGSVVFGRIFGTLAVSRAFGDREYKLKHSFVTCDPHVVIRPLTRKDSFLILACDGYISILLYAHVSVCGTSSNTMKQSCLWQLTVS